MDFWQEIRKLAGRTLYTLDQGKPFDVTVVDDQVAIIRVCDSNMERTLRRAMLQAAWDEFRRRGMLTRGEIGDRDSGWSSAYVAALFAALPGVEHSIRPITLRVQKTR